jgi:tetratricopeptide (TPR) repeat protein
VLSFDPVVYFLFLPDLSSWLYAPPVVRNEPGVVEATLQGLRQIVAKVPPSDAGGESRQVELVDSPEDLANKARTLIRKLFVNVFQDFLLFRAQRKEEDWLQNNLSRLDTSFLTAFQLVLDDCLPVQFGVAVSADNAGTAKGEMVKELQRIRTKLVTRVCLDCVITISQAQNLDSDYLEMLDRKIPKCVLDEHQLSGLIEVAASIAADPHASADLAYRLEALVAWAALQGGRPNPRVGYWAGYVANLEEYLVRHPERSPGLRVPDEFLKKTLDYRQVWNEIARRLRDENLGDIRARFAGAKPLFDLAERLGMGDLLADLMPRMRRVHGLDKIDEQTSPILFEAFSSRLDDDGGVAAYAEMVARVIRAGQPSRGFDAIKHADMRLAQTGRLDAASMIRCRAAQALNDSHELRSAERLLVSWIDHLKVSAEWERLRLATRLDLMNELGNSFRYAGKFQEAIALYTEALDLCADSLRDQRRVLLRNLGIAYRDSGRVLDGMNYLRESMQDEMLPVDRSAALHSIALCHDLLGDHRQALEHLEEALALLKSDGGEPFAQERMRLLISLAQNSMHVDDFRRAFTALDEARRLADDVLDSPFDSILCVVLMLRMGAEFAPSKTYKDLGTALADQFLSHERVRSSAEATMLLALAQITLQLGDRSRFERLMGLLESAPAEALSRDRWRLDGLKSWAAFNSGDLISAHSHLQESWRTLFVSFGSNDIAELPLTYLADRETIQSLTSSMVPQLVNAGHTPPTYLCLAAELQSSLMQNLSLSTDNEFRSQFLSRPLSEDWLAEDIEFLVSTGPGGRPTAFLHFLFDGSGYRPLMSLKQPGRPVEVRQGGSLDGHIVNKAWMELRDAVQLYNPAAREDPLANLPNWNALAGRMATLVRENIPPGSHVCIVPSRWFSCLPLHMSEHPGDGRPLIADYTFSYVPSVFVAARLRERRLADGREAVWKPDRVGNFVVWLTDDDRDVVESFTAHSNNIRHFLEAQGAIVIPAEGVAATRVAFGEMLQDTQMMHICCHGIANLRGRTHRLLVSDGKTLPPSDVVALANPQNDAFFVDWDKVGTQRAPLIVLSCACSSAVTSLQTAGERVGLERSLFRRGTSSFIAPLWNIVAFDIHRLTEQVLRNYYSSPDVDLGQAVQKTVLDGLSKERGRHAAGALALMGDWL